jgi:hypothetical protein
MTVAGVAALAVIAIAVPLVLAGTHGARPSPAPSGSGTATASATGTPAGVPSVAPDPAARDAAPIGLRVTVAGPTATLRWKLAGDNDFPLLVDAPSTGDPVVSLWPRTTSYTAIGLKPGTEYCFKVGAMTADSHQGTTIKWSDVVCSTVAGG